MDIYVVYLDPSDTKAQISAINVLSCSKCTRISQITAATLRCYGRGGRRFEAGWCAARTGCCTSSRSFVARIVFATKIGPKWQVVERLLSMREAQGSIPCFCNLPNELALRSGVNWIRFQSLCALLWASEPTNPRETCSDWFFLWACTSPPQAPRGVSHLNCTPGRRSSNQKWS